MVDSIIRPMSKPRLKVLPLSREHHASFGWKNRAELSPDSNLGPAAPKRSAVLDHI